MKWIEAKVLFDHKDFSMASELVAEIFYDLGLKGVIIDDPEQDPTQDWGSNAVPPPVQPAIKGYFPDIETTSEKCTRLEKKIKALSERTRMKTHITYSRLDEEDWAESWKEFFWPEKITDRIVVKPTWRDYQRKPGDIIVEIDPGMAFGTGTHPTTSMCIQMIESHLKPDDTFLDIGTGSGILMITAAKLGARHVCGVDNDAVAVRVAEKNLEQNHMSKNDCTLFTGNLVDNINTRFDVVTANILAEVIMELSADVKTVLAENGRFICSGIIQPRKQDVLNRLAADGFDLVDIIEKEEWVAIAASVRQ